ncbi:hypothetical protein OE88DRAFT_634916 [Heliocybe sulcata]|uniref:Secreted protein n=1 Tax=Heliocybe sulcata TaxID=5364 RepID=A0A5C3NGG2_9AGAM|nr:hypothetical protein OE88DRAFT_634916 [Heliocybe sulcata]
MSPGSPRISTVYLSAYLLQILLTDIAPCRFALETAVVLLGKRDPCPTFSNPPTEAPCLLGLRLCFDLTDSLPRKGSPPLIKGRGYSAE